MLLWVTGFSHQGCFLLAISPKQCLSPAPKQAIAAALAAHCQLPFRHPGGLSTRPSPACFPLVSASQASPSLVLYSPAQVPGLASWNTHYFAISTRPSGARPAAWSPHYNRLLPQQLATLPQLHLCSHCHRSDQIAGNR